MPKYYYLGDEILFPEIDVTIQVNDRIDNEARNSIELLEQLITPKPWSKLALSIVLLVF